VAEYFFAKRHYEQPRMEAIQKTIYLHIGMHKTGTTSVQYHFMGLREYFLKEHGIYYPPAPGFLNHRHKSLFPIDAAKFRKIVDFAEQHRCRAILLSNESLSLHGVDEASLERIRAAAPGWTVTFIIYVRRIDELCKAWFNEECKNGDLAPGETYAASVRRAYSRKACMLFPSRLIEKCIGQVGRENVILKRYIPEELLNRDIVDDFCAVLGVTLPPEKRAARRLNTSPPHRALPYFTPAVFSSSSYGYTEMQLQKKLHRAFSYPGAGGTVPPEIKQAVAREVETLESGYLPGYKKAFEKKPLSMDFPELEADPYRVYVVELLHSIYRRVHWPERVVWRIGVFFYYLGNKVSWLQKTLLRFVPGSDSEKKP